MRAKIENYEQPHNTVEWNSIIQRILAVCLSVRYDLNYPTINDDKF